MTGKELIDSGILELYCFVIATEEERQTVEMLAANDDTVRNEINEIKTALNTYAGTLGPHKSKELKQQIFDRIDHSTGQPPLLDSNSSAAEWLRYINELELKQPDNLDGISIEELSVTSESVTMILWGKKGGIISDEEHEDLDEHILICKGSCEMTAEGKKVFCRSGDYLCIHSHQIHSGKVTSDEMMIAIVQRRAA
ncbi:MAG: hypothetical protein ACHQD9_01865 [Chitinophagales bacterium]